MLFRCCSGMPCPLTKASHRHDLSETCQSSISTVCATCLAVRFLSRQPLLGLTHASCMQAARLMAAVKRAVAGCAHRQLPLRAYRAAGAVCQLRVHRLEHCHMRCGGQAGHAAGQRQAQTIDGITQAPLSSFRYWMRPDCQGCRHVLGVGIHVLWDTKVDVRADNHVCTSSGINSLRLAMSG